jgi:PST family polysaccharide transporter
MSLTSPNEQIAVPSLEAAPEAKENLMPGNHSYRQILKSSALVGGSSAVNIAVGIIRTKAMAILLGPAGFGLFGVYGSIINVTQTLAGMGVNTSGVRQIAEAIGSADAERIAITTIVLRRASFVLGLFGALFLIVFSRQVATLTFGNSQHYADVALLSAAVFFQLVSAGQSALVQGMRRIRDLAKLGAVGAALGTVVSILIVYFLHEKGVTVSLVAVALMSLALSWWYSRTVRVPAISIAHSQLWREASALLKLGFAFMAGGFMTIGIAYVVRIVLVRKVGFEATGFYQSAWTLGGLYVGFILQAMSADFYPRLSANADDNTACNRLVNEQTQVGILLAGPGLLATLTFASVVIRLFYSAKFGAAVGVLRWICMGAVLQVISWPMGFVIVAKARRATYFATELAWALVSLVLAWTFIEAFGLNGAGIAFFGSYVFYAFMLYVVVHRISGFCWSAENKRTGLTFLVLITGVFCAFYMLPFVWSFCLGTLAVIISGIYSSRILLTLVSLNSIPASFRRVLLRLGLVPEAPRNALDR